MTIEPHPNLPHRFVPVEAGAEALHLLGGLIEADKGAGEGGHLLDGDGLLGGEPEVVLDGGVGTQARRGGGAV